MSPVHAHAHWNALASQVLSGTTIEKSTAKDILTAPSSEILLMLHAGFRLREHFFGRVVNIHVLKNAKQGVCPEDCGFCSQSLRHGSRVQKTKMASAEEIIQSAEDAAKLGAKTYCVVTSTRGPSKQELQTICQAAQSIKQRVDLKLCVSLGALNADQARLLAQAGVDRYNHNIETSQNFFQNIVTTHQYEDRIHTIKAAKTAGLEICAGGLIGLGESIEDRVDFGFALQSLDVDSIPINFLDPRKGTPLENAPRLTPEESLRMLIMMRFLMPSKDIRMAGGREVNLRMLQPLGLFVATSMFSNGYLTTGGQGFETDAQMILDAGFSIAKIDHT